MNQQPPSMQPPSQPAKQIVTGIAIAGVCISMLTLLFDFIGMMLASILSAAASNPSLSHESLPLLQLILKVLFIVFAIALLAGSFGCFLRREWGRRLLLGYAVLYPIALVVEILGTVGNSGQLTSTTYGPGGTTHTTVVETHGIMMGVAFWETIIAMMLMILPVMILVFLRKPAVREIFRD